MDSLMISALYNHCWVRQWKNSEIGQPKLWSRIELSCCFDSW